MIQFGSSVARESPWRVATVLGVIVCALRCQAPSDDGLFEAALRGAAGTPTVNAVETPADLPDESDVEVEVPGAGGSAASTEGSPPLTNPPLLGLGGTAGESPPLTGLAGAMGSPDVTDARAAVDAGIAPIADCVLGEFQTPELLTGIEQSLNPDLALNLWSPSLSTDGRTLFFAISADGIDEQLATATRDDRGAVFSPATALAAINSPGQDGTPLLSADGLSLYFHSTREGGVGNRDVWLSTRADAGAEFTAPTLVAGVNGADVDHLPWVSPDELTLLWATNRSGGVGQDDIWMARRTVRGEAFSSVAPLPGINGTSNEGRAVLAADDLTIYFSSDRPGGVGGLDLWVATRNDGAGSFSQVANLAAVNSASSDTDLFLSADQRELLFSSARDGRIRLWRSIRECE
jgi:hypothetical protein